MEKTGACRITEYVDTEIFYTENGKAGYLNGYNNEARSRLG